MYSFSWVVGLGADAQGGRIYDPKLNEVIDTLDAILDNSGSIRIEISDAPEIGPESLQVESELGATLISLGENTEEDYEVRSYKNSSQSEEMIEILGNKWDSKMVCFDRNAVRKIVIEFFQTKNVPRSLLE